MLHGLGTLGGQGSEDKGDTGQPPTEQGCMIVGCRAISARQARILGGIQGAQGIMGHMAAHRGDGRTGAWGVACCGPAAAERVYSKRNVEEKGHGSWGGSRLVSNLSSGASPSEQSRSLSVSPRSA